ncbi:DUF1564 family protein [Leptospira idonii]|uniref:DUF1564 family protein n=1 Tax=Leptospira idonii TaxID=1193500 RepID=A0A4R9M4H4_9LEPT|nr:DUF1564 family protein [Leptospira idonii]TGN20149.1 DUF1564 family protein [Leptospira idonii]
MDAAYFPSSYVSEPYDDSAFSSEQEIDFCFESFKTVNTSFLVPEEFLNILFHRKKGTFSYKIRCLLEESAFMIYYGKLSRKKNKLTRSYQKKDQSLKKVSCRVWESDLLEMDLMAQSLGISRSHLLSLLLEWESLGWLAVVRGLGGVRDTTSLQRLQVHQLYDRTAYPFPIYKTSIKQYIDPGRNYLYTS